MGRDGAVLQMGNCPPATHDAAGEQQVPHRIVPGVTWPSSNPMSRLK